MKSTMLSAKDMIVELLEKKISKRRISKLLGVEWSTVNNWMAKDQIPEDENLKNLAMLHSGICKTNGRKSK